MVSKLDQTFSFFGFRMVKKDAVSNKAKKRLKKEEELLESSWKLANNMYKGIWNDRWDSIKESILTKQNELEVLNAYSDASFAVKDGKSVDSWKKYKSGVSNGRWTNLSWSGIHGSSGSWSG